MTRKTDKDPYPLLDELQAQLTKDRTKATNPPLEAELQDEALAGHPLITRRPFKADGRQYAAGDEITLEPGHKLLHPRYVTTRSRWELAGRYNERFKFHRDVLTPQISVVNQARKTENVASARVLALRQQLKEAEDDLKTAISQRQGTEAELYDRLTGPDLSA